MERYEIWRAKVKFEESDEVKERPVMIWNNQVFLVAYKMTGTDRGDDQDEYKIRYWKEAGLDKPTSIRLRKVLRTCSASPHARLDGEFYVILRCSASKYIQYSFGFTP